jgi:3-oxoacyl-(acyl-carrier-protein) synthase
VRKVPAPAARPGFLAHGRLRRSSPISHFTVAAALEALGEDAREFGSGRLKLGILVCVMSGCVNYSRRFYDEVLRDPSTASPLVFPETVFNAPSSHLAALLGSTAMNYTLVGDPGTFVLGLALAAQWIAGDLVEACLVVGAEELDWLTADAFHLFTRRVVIADGAGAIYLGKSPRDNAAIELTAITDPQLFWDRHSRAAAAGRMAAELQREAGADVVWDGLLGVPALDRPEAAAWEKWPGRRVSVKRTTGEGLMAASAWQCVLAAEDVARGAARQALVSVVGCNEQAVGCRFARGMI